MEIKTKQYTVIMMMNIMMMTTIIIKIIPVIMIISRIAYRIIILQVGFEKSAFYTHMSTQLPFSEQKFTINCKIIV